ncbi:MAG: excinuclease ABC subunit UvrC [Actinomycetota bacterium]|nr:excinuclease ABC subunit UvrC [Actinomycetota bacterium]MDK1017446.1 excinuclease ABC subunit UvrC [Actinomycetota bacterium]MDK1027316.1 excinuclease ABC subunit UvrC [Actinomycetota bacterium]MDK1039347.1 excinuclease ABC subunit UvrC [Actinomycetota bacterium]MDK1097477.1 excinuclease ABC subunit UvrC [Actinomycetota bacterium]
MLKRPPPSSIPNGPGVYVFKDAHGRPLYVGKAKSLRKRTANYFAKDLAPRTRTMVGAAADLDWIVTDSELSALMLEYSLIQELQPTYNVRLKDDKSFPYLAITRNEEWPRAVVMRGKRKKGVEYFGPYAKAYSIRHTLDVLLRTYPVRTCTNAKFKRHQATGRPCLLFDIEKCSGPCVGEISKAAYTAQVDGLASFLSGDSGELIADLEKGMHAAAQQQEFERAARLRDQIAAMRVSLERQELVTHSQEDFDVIAFAEDDLEVALVVLNVKKGRVTGTKATVVDRVEDITIEAFLERMIGQLYIDESPPNQVLVPILPTDHDVVSEWLTLRRGSRVSLRVPQRGAKRRILAMAAANAEEEFARNRLKRHSDYNARARALQSLQDALGLRESPLRIECYDISTIQGRHTVGSMVVFEDGLPVKAQYRRFKIKTVDGQDDFASMEELIRRRFEAYLAETALPLVQQGRFSYAPGLVVIDGGRGQLGRAVAVLSDLNLDIPVIGLAKRLEEVFVPGRADPVILPRGTEALYLLQRLRDEAHRFAVAYHRALRTKSMVDSILDDVRGIGPGRKKKLINAFGSVKRMREASIADLGNILPDRVASELYDALHEG